MNKFSYKFKKKTSNVDLWKRRKYTALWKYTVFQKLGEFRKYQVILLVLWISVCNLIFRFYLEIFIMQEFFMLSNHVDFSNKFL